MSAESTRKVIDGYAQALLSFGDYARYLTEDVTLTIEGTDRAVSGREAVRQMITFMHTQAFKTNIQVKSVLYGDRQAMLEAEFVGTHVGTFEGIPATHRDVRVPYAVAYDVDPTGITALRLYFPMEALMRQIGAAETVGTGARN
jgi:predicted ester cyclase